MPGIFPNNEAAFARLASELVTRFATWWRKGDRHEAHVNALESMLATYKQQTAEFNATKARYEIAKRAQLDAKRKLMRQINFMRDSASRDDTLSDAEREAMKLRPRKVSRKDRGLVLVAPPPVVPQPVVELVEAGSMRHGLKIAQPDATRRIGKPTLVTYVELRVAFTHVTQGAPKDENAYQHIGIFFDTTPIITVPPRWVGYQAHYRARWITKSGEMGPWSDVLTTMVAA